MKTSETIDKISAALAKAQGQLKTVAFNKTNPYFHSKYADLTAIVEACKGVLSEAELAVIQGTQLEGMEWTLVTRLQHSSGQYYESYVPLFLNKKDMQSLGSAITYARRYGFCSMLGLTSDEDDDANASVAVQKSSQTTKQQSASKPVTQSTTRPQELNTTTKPMSSAIPVNQTQQKANSAVKVSMTQVSKLFAQAVDQGYKTQEIPTIIKKLVQKTRSDDMTQSEYDLVFNFVTQNKRTPELMAKMI